jgi:hypothetical protein
MEYVFHSIRPSYFYSHANQHISNLEHLHIVFHSLPSFPRYPIPDLILTHLGYDDNDLDLDLLCRDIVRRDIQSLKRAPCANAWLGPHARVGLDYHREAEAEMRAAAQAEDKTRAFAAAGIRIVPTVDAPEDAADESAVASGVDVVDARTHGTELSPFGSGTELVHRTSAMAVVSSSMDGV